MKTEEKIKKAFEYFKKEYSCKMGGTQTVVLPNGKRKYFDDKQYYSGRGSKFNLSIRHDEVGSVIVSKNEYNKYLSMIKERDAENNKRIKEAKAKAKRIKEAEKMGAYSIKDNFIELSEKEMYNHFYDSKRLANTLNISIKDAELLNSDGKTYVYAEQSNGNVIELYHAALSCNPLTITVDFNAKDKFKAKNKSDWKNAPYRALIGATENNNHFVC